MDFLMGFFMDLAPDLTVGLIVGFAVGLAEDLVVVLEVVAERGMRGVRGGEAFLNGSCHGSSIRILPHLWGRGRHEGEI